MHGSCLIDMYNEVTSERCTEMIKSGWERSEILDAILLGSKNLPSLHPFADIDPLESEEIPDFSETEQTHPKSCLMSLIYLKKTVKKEHFHSNLLLSILYISFLYFL